MKRSEATSNQKAKRARAEDDYWAGVLRQLQPTESKRWLERLAALPDNALGYVPSAASTALQRHEAAKQRHPQLLVLTETRRGTWQTYGADALILQALLEKADPSNVAVVSAADLDSTLERLALHSVEALLLRSGEDVEACLLSGGAAPRPIVGIVPSSGGFVGFRIWWSARLIELLPESSDANDLLRQPHAPPLYLFCALTEAKAMRRVELRAAPNSSLQQCAQQAAAHYASSLGLALPQLRAQAGAASWMPRCTERELLCAVPLHRYALPPTARRASLELIRDWLERPPSRELAEARSDLIKHWQQSAAPPRGSLPLRAGQHLHLQLGSRSAISSLLEVRALIELVLRYRHPPAASALPLLLRCLDSAPDAVGPDFFRQLELLYAELAQLAPERDPYIPSGGGVPTDYWIELWRSSLALRLRADRLEPVEAACEALDAAALRQSGRVVTMRRSGRLVVGLRSDRPHMEHPLCVQLQTSADLLKAEQELWRLFAEQEHAAELQLARLVAVIGDHALALQLAWQLALLAQTTYEHAVQAALEHWMLPQLVQPDQELKGRFWPYYLRRSDAVSWEIQLDGVLFLTGCNQGGKTTLQRSLAAVAQLAQCGLAVPGRGQVPRYSQVYLRISGGDAPLHGKSNFLCEAEDLVHALATDRNALLLLDELPRCSEQRDLLALGAATLEELAEGKRRAIYSTHLWDALGAVAAPLQSAIRPLQISLAHELRSGLCDQSMAAAALQQACASPSLIRRFERLRGLPAPESSRPLLGSPWSTASVESPELDCGPPHPAVELLRPLLEREPIWIGSNDQVPVHCCSSHALYLRVQTSAPMRLYVGESKNMYKRAAQHRQLHSDAGFYVWLQSDSTEAEKLEQRCNRALMASDYYVESQREARKRF